MEQRSPEWYSARLGKVTASRVADVVARTKSGYAATRANYMAFLVCERLTGQRGVSFQSAAMVHGMETEPAARAAYEARTGDFVVEVGFVVHPVITMSGASPDGLVGDDGLIEIKCPNTSTHIDILLEGNIPSQYITQMQWQMACTGRQWCDFVSYDPRLPENMQLFVKRVMRYDWQISMLETEVNLFLAELNETIITLTNKYGEPNV